VASEKSNRIVPGQAYDDVTPDNYTNTTTRLVQVEETLNKFVLRIQATVTSLPVSAVSSTTWSIPIKPGYSHGTLILSVTLGGINSRRAGYYKFGTELDDAHGFGPSVTSNMVSLSAFNDRWQSGFSYAADGALSDRYFNKSGSQVYLKSIQINGENLDLVFTNAYGGTGFLTLVATVDLWKG